MIYSQMKDAVAPGSSYSKIVSLRRKIFSLHDESKNSNLLHNRYNEIQKELQSLSQQLKYAERENRHSQQEFLDETFKNLLSQEYGPERGKIFDIIYQKAYEDSDHNYYSVESKFSELVDFVNEVRENI